LLPWASATVFVKESPDFASSLMSRGVAMTIVATAITEKIRLACFTVIPGHKKSSINEDGPKPVLVIVLVGSGVIRTIVLATTPIIAALIIAAVPSKLQQLAAVLQGRVIRAVVMAAPPLAASAAAAAIVTRRVILAVTGEQQYFAFGLF